MFDFEGYLPFILKGMVLTIEVAMLSLLVSVVLGMLAALAKLSLNPLARLIAGVYTTIIRGVPDLVLMFVLFFGGQVLVNKIGDFFGWGYIDVDAFVAGTLTIGFILGAYMAETFRGGILAVPRGEIEAGFAFGMRASQVFTRITFPQMVRHALPGFTNNWLVLAKTTALVSVIGLPDMLYNAGVAGGGTRQPFKFYLVAAVGYLVITAVSQQILNRVEQRYSVGVREV